METLKIDGSIGHGGGQILRSALALSAILGKPFEMHSIRKDRNQSGLRRQHLCGVLATAEICGAKLEGAELGSEDLLFIPKRLKQELISLLWAQEGVSRWSFKACFFR